jgi:ribosomal protein S18 acetylase RimI-like enzyme
MVELREVDPDDPDARHCIAEYFAELNRRADHDYDPAAGVSADRQELIAPAGAFLVAYLDGAVVGCGAVKHPGGRAADIKRMWVDGAARGQGIAKRMLAELEERARAAGAEVAHLETNGALTEAIAMYRSSGYVEVEPFNSEPFADHWFEKPLVVENEA